MRTGGATPEGTARFRARFPRSEQAGHFRRLGRLAVSSIGLGTYLGEPTDEVDRAYETAIEEAISRGCNLFDCAAVYRDGRSERALSRGLSRAFDRGLASRDEIVVCTKVGFQPDGTHSLEPELLVEQLAECHGRLELETIDLVYLHNPETQLVESPAEVVEERIGAAFDALEGALRSGSVGGYGLATWEGLRLPAEAPGALRLEQLVGRAGEGFVAVQAPLNLAMPEALAAPTQPIGEVAVPLAVATRHFGLALFASASILQGRLGELPPEMAAAFPEQRTDTQRALQFTRSLPGVTAALVGMSDVAHVRENLELAEQPVASLEAIQGLFAH